MRSPALPGSLHREQGGGAAGLADQADRAEVEDLRPPDGFEIDLVGAVAHVGAGVAVEHELAFAIGAQRDERQGGARLGVEADAGDVHTVLRQGLGQEVPEGIVTYLAQEAGAGAQFRQPDGDIGGRSAGRLLESRRFDQRDARDRGHKVDQQFAEGDHVSHS
jgi:hypothetical protein